MFQNGFEKLAYYFDVDKNGVVEGAELAKLKVWVDDDADAHAENKDAVSGADDDDRNDADDTRATQRSVSILPFTARMLTALVVASRQQLLHARRSSTQSAAARVQPLGSSYLLHARRKIRRPLAWCQAGTAW